MTEYSISTQTASGLELLISVAEYNGRQHQISVTVPGKVEGVATKVDRIVHTVASHCLDCKPPVGIMADVAAQINSLIAAREAEWQESTPEGRMARERREYHELVETCRDISDEIDDLKERVYRLDTGAGWDKVREAERRLESARQAALDYRTIHGDLDAALKAEAAERTRSFLAAD